VATVCDHGDDAAVAAVAERIATEHGRLDLLVNNVRGGYERLNAGARAEWNAPLWEQPVEVFDAMFAAGGRVHCVRLRPCAPELIATPGSLVVTVSFAVPEAEQAGFGAAYAMAKSADDRLALAAAVQLREHAVASLALHTGLVRTERVMQFAEHLDLTRSQSVEGVGRAVVALADDPELPPRHCNALVSRRGHGREAATRNYPFRLKVSDGPPSASGSARFVGAAWADRSVEPAGGVYARHSWRGLCADSRTACGPTRLSCPARSRTTSGKSSRAR